MSTTSSDELHAWLRSRHGVVPGPIVRAYLTPGELRTALRRGRLARVQRDVFVDPGAPPTEHQRLLAAVYSTGGVASHRSAAAMWMLDESWPASPEVVVPPNRRPKAPGITVHRCSVLDDSMIDLIDNVPVTTPALTALHLAAVAGPRTVERAIDRGLVRQLFSVEDLHSLLNRIGRSGRDGAGALRAVLGLLGPAGDGADSVFEVKAARLFARAGLEELVMHFVVRDAKGVPIAELDFACPRRRVGVELDGYDVHGTPNAHRLDLERQNRLIELGWTLLRFTWAQITRRPAEVADQIARVLRSLDVA